MPSTKTRPEHCGWELGWTNRYNRENETFTRFTVNQGLPSGEIQCILGDRSGRLWLGTKKGISRFDPQTGRFRSFDTSDGLQSNDFSAGCFQDSQSGEMLFGGYNGIPLSILKISGTIPTCPRQCEFQDLQ